MSTIPGPGAAQSRTGVAVVTDSTTYLPPALFEHWGIAHVSLYVGWEGEHLPEGEYELDDFYARLQSSPSLPSTSQPSVGDFLAVYEPLAAAGHDVVSIHIAAGLSGTCESAREAARTLAERGLALEGVVETVRETRAGLEIWFCLDTLEYLRKGGRIGAARALLGTALKIKPILTFGTEIAPVGRVRTAKRAHERMVAYLQELSDRGASGWIIQHAQLPEEAASLLAAGEEILGTEPLFCTEVGPVLGAHLGSGVLVGGIGLAPTTAE